MSDEEPIKSLAARIMRTRDANEDEVARLAGYVMGDADPERTTAHQIRQGEIDIPGGVK